MATAKKASTTRRPTPPPKKTTPPPPPYNPAKRAGAPTAAELRSSSKNYKIGNRRANSKAATYKDYYSSRGVKGDREGDRR